MSRPKYVYTLDVEYPEWATKPGWTPKGYVDVDSNGLDAFLPRNPDGTYRFPRCRSYLTATTANRRAALMEDCGCKVTVLRSDPISFPDAPPPKPSLKRMSEERARKAEADLLTSLQALDDEVLV